MESSFMHRLGPERCKKRQRTDSDTTFPSLKLNSTMDVEIEATENDIDSQHRETEANAAQFVEVGHPHARLAQLPAVRTVLDEVLSPELCQELLFVFRATSTIGYRPHVRSATIHDVSTTAPWLLPPLIRARHAVLSAVEAAFGLSLELAVEFSGLMGWARGAVLGWHHDSNREYLSRRHLSAVLYLNTQGDEFGAGDFRFRDGPGPLRVAPRVGRLVAYTADRRNVHCVEEVAWGERCTLTCWFSLEPSASEDPLVIQRLCCNPAIRVSPHLPSGFGLGSQPLPPPSSSAPAHTAIAQQAGEASESLAPEVDLNPGRGGTFSVLVLRRCWWRRYLGPGLPTSMYQLPAGPCESPVRVRGGVAEEQSGDVGFRADGGATKCDADWRGGAAAEGGSEGTTGGRGAVAREECGGVGREGDLRLERLRCLGLVVVATAGGMRSGGRDGILRTSPRARRKHPQCLGTTVPPCTNKMGSMESTVAVTKESPGAVQTSVTGGGSLAEFTAAAAATAVRPCDAAYDSTSGQAQVARSQTHRTVDSGTPAADLAGNAGGYGSCSDGEGRGGPEENPACGQESRDVKMQEVEDEEEEGSKWEEAISREDIWVALVDELEATEGEGTLCHGGIESTKRSGGNEADDDDAVIAPMSARGLAAPSLLWFPGPSAALLAAQFAAYTRNIQRFRSIVQLEEAVRELPAYAHQRMEELLTELPTWKTLGVMLSDD